MGTPVRLDQSQQPITSGLIGQFIAQRPMIDYAPGDIYGSKPSGYTHNGQRCRVVMSRNVIHIGCSDVTPRALRQLLRDYETRFCAAHDEFVVQE